jgi:hypothetical protein
MLDTRAKRYSAIHLGSPWRGILPIPDATLGQADRQTIFFLCGAILAVPLAAPPAHTTPTLIRNAQSHATLGVTPTGFSFLTTTPTAYANLTVSPGTLDQTVEDPDE